jgi:hypothetical protein
VPSLDFSVAGRNRLTPKLIVRRNDLNKEKYYFLKFADIAFVRKCIFHSETVSSYHKKISFDNVDSFASWTYNFGQNMVRINQTA